jgi:predicted outer membrane repeat protein
MFSKGTSQHTIVGCFAIVLIGLVSQAVFAATTRHVNTLSDDGTPGSFRYEIAHAMAGDTINFQLTGCPCTIMLTSGAISLYRPITITGPGSTQLAISGNNNDRIFYVAAKGTTSISGLELRDGIQAGGGAIVAFGDMALSDIAFRHNRSSGLVGDNSYFGSGGALYVVTNVSVSVAASLFENNSAGSEYYGGAITSSGTLHIRDSTFIGNEADMCGAVMLAGDSTITNSTFTDNQTIGDVGAPGSGWGGAICVWNGDVSIINSTIADNAASREGGGIAAPTKFRLANSVVANNAAPVGPDISGAIASKGYNLVSNRDDSSGYRTSACTGPGDSPADLPEQDPNLSPLHIDAISKLPVFTPNPRSPLVDTIVVGGASCDGFNVPPRDARGVTRPYGTKADIGAVEFIPDDDRIFCDGIEGAACVALH